MRKVFGLICCFILSVSSFQIEASDVRLISVTGLVEKSFKPDIVRLIVTVWGKGKNAKDAQNSNNAHFDALKKTVETYKVKTNDVVTVSYELTPEYTYVEKTGRNKVIGYVVNQNLVIVLRTVADAAPFIDSLIALSSPKTFEGGVSVLSLVYDLDKRVDEERALLAAAVKEAESKAELLAKAANVKLKGIYRLIPRDASAPTPVGQMEHLQVRMKDRSGDSATQLMSGEVKVEGYVSAEYLID